METTQFVNLGLHDSHLPDSSSRDVRPGPLQLSRKILLVALVASVASVGTVTGLVFAPGSPGYPISAPRTRQRRPIFGQCHRIISAPFTKSGISSPRLEKGTLH